MTEIRSFKEINLKPCPFCCSTDVRVIDDDRHVSGVLFRVGCRGCGATGPVRVRLQYQSTEAVQAQVALAWNDQGNKALVMRKPTTRASRRPPSNSTHVHTAAVPRSR